jgi:hypothetical protein
MELELIDPTLFVALAPEVPRRLAERIVNLVMNG